METDLRHLGGSLVEAITILEQDAKPLEARVHYALAVLRAAFVYHCDALTDHAPTPANDPVDQDSGECDDDVDDSALRSPAPRRLADYRQERGMHIPAFTAFLGIAHADYAAVVRRCPIDRRLRDQIAYKLGVAWQAIAEFMSEPPKPRPPPEPIPAPDDARPPRKPWYLVDEATGRVLSGPHVTPVPMNGSWIDDPLTGGRLNLVVLHDYSWTTEEDWLPPEGYSAELLREMYPDWDWDAGDDADSDRSTGMTRTA